MLIHEIQKDRRLKNKPRIQYHLNKLRDLDLITIKQGWEYTQDRGREQ